MWHELCCTMLKEWLHCAFFGRKSAQSHKAQRLWCHKPCSLASKNKIVKHLKSDPQSIITYFTAPLSSSVLWWGDSESSCWGLLWKVRVYFIQFFKGSWHVAPCWRLRLPPLHHHCYLQAMVFLHSKTLDWGAEMSWLRGGSFPKG